MLDDDIAALGARLTWAPAHKSLAAALLLRRSDGQRCTIDDWRANRLVDAVAKESARTPEMLARHNAIRDHRALVAHSTAVLGCVTFAAAHVERETITSDGTVVKLSLIHI